MKQTLVPGATLDALTPDEARELLRQEYRATVEQRVRAEGTLKLDGTGSGIVEVYTCPIGFEFEARRAVIAIDAGYWWFKTVPLGGIAGGSAVVPLEYLRSGETNGRPNADYVRTGGAQDEVWYLVPHLDTWSREQGPYIRNGETFEVAFRAIPNAANMNVQVTVEGIQRRPPPVRD